VLDEGLTGVCSHDLRKSIARVLTIINAKQRSQLRLFYKTKKYIPLDLRAKQTRAIRRRLSPEDASRQLEKTKKRQTHFPQRKFAVKVRQTVWVTGERCPATLVPYWHIRHANSRHRLHEGSLGLRKGWIQSLGTGYRKFGTPVRCIIQGNFAFRVKVLSEVNDFSVWLGSEFSCQNKAQK